VVNNGTEEPAVRLLQDGDNQPGEPVEAKPRSTRLILPGLLVVGLLGVFFITTRPSDTPTQPSTTARAPSIVALEQQTVDARTTEETELTRDWQAAPFDGAAEISAVTDSDGLHIAVGTLDEQSHVWWSPTGTTWRAAATVERPGGMTGLCCVTSWSGGLVALGEVAGGTGVWTSQGSVDTWEYMGDLGTDTILGIAAGPELLTISQSDSTTTAWTSPDGISWTQHESLSGLDSAQPIGLVGDDEAYYLYGGKSTGQRSFGSAAIFRSEDGIDWQPVLSSEVLGGVTDVTITEDGFVAVGQAIGDRDVGGPDGSALWQSSDGIEWEQITTTQPPVPIITIAVTAVRPGDFRSAEIRVNESEATVAEGTTIETDIGSFVVETIIERGIQLRGDDFFNFVSVGEPIDLAWFVPLAVAAAGEDILVTGVSSGFGPLRAMLWVSADAGLTWSWEWLPSSVGVPVEISLNGDLISVIASGGDGTGVWHARLDIRPPAETAEARLREYIEALSDHDATALIRTLPEGESAARATFEIPTLGHHPAAWWDGDGDLDLKEVTGVTDYLAAMNTSVTVDECSTTASPGANRVVVVVCVYTANSDLLAAFGIEDGQGRINAVVRDGMVRSVVLEIAPSAAAWVSLSQLSGSDIQAPFTADAAQGHLAAAHDYLAGVLRPGETKTVETALGTIEWTWLEPDEFGPLSRTSIVRSSLGYTLVGYVWDDGNYVPRMFTSDDASDWEQVPLPDDVNALSGLEAFVDGLIAVQSSDDGVSLVYYDGTDWAQIGVPAVNPVNSQLTVTSGDHTALVLVRVWAGGDTDTELFMIDSELNVTPATLPQPIGDSTGFQVVDTEDGFAALVTHTDSGESSLWSTADGRTWQLIDDTLVSRAETWSLDLHKGRYFVSAQANPVDCGQTALGDRCAWAGVWSSIDGTEWDQLSTSTGGVMASGDVVSGPLGMIALGETWADTSGGEEPAGGLPTTVYLSADGDVWQEVAGIALLGPPTELSLGFTPLVGDDRILIVGTSYPYESTLDPNSYLAEGSERFYMIVGRVVDGSTPGTR